MHLTSDYIVVFPKLTYATDSSIQYFGGGGSSDYNYNNYKLESFMSFQQLGEFYIGYF